MKTLQDILDNYKTYKVALDDRFGVRLCKFLTNEQAAQIGFSFKDGYVNTPVPWTEENILKQLQKDVEFGFEKALNQRSISASLMYETVKSWCVVLENGLDTVDYPMYGLLLFKEVAVKYGFDNPIGEDSGSEDKYNE